MPNGFIHDSQDQNFYDSFNNFIFSNDIKVFNKLISKYLFLDKTEKIPGDIVELGVFKGSGMVTWLKMLKSKSINNKKCIGFDIFDKSELIKNINTNDDILMNSLFEDRGFNPKGYGDILSKLITSAGYINYEIVTGNVFETIPIYIEKNPGFRASIINFDLDTEEPTYFCLSQLYDRIVPGGIMIFDEYGINEWTESAAVDKFIYERGLILQRTNFDSPSAFIIKA